MESTAVFVAIKNHLNFLSLEAISRRLKGNVLESQKKTDALLLRKIFLLTKVDLWNKSFNFDDVFRENKIPDGNCTKEAEDLD